MLTHAENVVLFAQISSAEPLRGPIPTSSSQPWFGSGRSHIRTRRSSIESRLREELMLTTGARFTPGPDASMFHRGLASEAAYSCSTTRSPTLANVRPATWTS